MFRFLATLALIWCLSGCSSGPAGPPVVEHADALNGGTVTVRKGDTAWLIARRQGVPLKALIQANGLRPPYLLEVGQRLRVPKLRLHRVKSGESISLIAERYRVSRFQLAQLNRIGPPYRIFPNQVLRVPQSEPVRVAARSPVRKPPPLPPARPSDTVIAKAEPTAPVRARKTEPKPIAPRAVATKLKGMIWPVAGKVISSFGAKPGGLHNDGVNIAAASGAPVRAAGAGTVVYAGNELRGFGNLVLIRHGGGLTTAYAHLQETLVARGQKVDRGSLIATVGDSGGVAPTQLHFEIRKGRKALNPIRQLGPVPAREPEARLSRSDCVRLQTCEALGESNG